MRFAHFQFDPDTDRLGEGPLSEVYKAVDLQLGRTVALKILRSHAEIDPQADTRFLREAKHTSALAHPNITTIYEYGQDQGTSFIAMEYLQGRTLEKIIKDQALGYEECVRIAMQLTQALAVVHKHNLIHRDLKPANILLQDDGNLKLLDFGIARARDEAGITQHGMLVGTVLYMSPEQVRGDELDFRSDIFSLGAVLYHVMAGALPFPGESFPEVCMAILDGQPPRRPSQVRSGFPPALEEYILRCMNPDPGRRFVNAEAAHAGLATVADNLTGTNARRQTALTGTLLLPEIQCGGSTPRSCHVMASGVRKDLAGALSRNKGLTVVLHPDITPPTGEAFDYYLGCNLTVEGHRGKLELSLGTYRPGENGPQLVETLRDTVTHTDDDEWTLQENLVRSSMRILRKRIAEASLLPTFHGDRKEGEAKAYASKAREVLHRGTTKHLLAASSMLRRALDLDPYSAEAFACLAEAKVRKFLYWDGDTSFLDEAREHSGRALALDPQCALAHTALGFANHLSGYYEDAQREYRLAIQIDNKEWLAHRLRGAILAREGNFKNASPLLQRTIGLKPSHIAAYDHLFTVLQRLDRYEEALEIADKGIAAARKHLARVADDMDARLHLAMLYARLGNEEGARTEVDAARRRAPKDGYTAFHAGCIFALLGEPLEAISAISLAQDRGYFVKSELMRNTDLDILRGLPEFQELAN
ncbi:MAG: protein kinase [bacterium]|nr:protein kinase [bacterium]